MQVQAKVRGITETAYVMRDSGEFYISVTRTDTGEHVETLQDYVDFREAHTCAIARVRGAVAAERHARNVAFLYN